MLTDSPTKTLTLLGGSINWWGSNFQTWSKQINAMRIIQFLFFMSSLLASSLAHASELAQQLEGVDHVLLMRHTRAPGVGDPTNYTLTDCNTQRNLSAEGRKQAIAIGNWLKKQGIQQASVYSSAWCRCKDTAELLNYGQYQVEPSLASFFDEMHKAKERTQQLETFIASQIKTKGKKALILVTHHVNIFDYMGENIDSGDMVLVKVDGNGRMVSYKRIPRPN
jgi:phosphohistidine phosphatase SixA